MKDVISLANLLGIELPSLSDFARMHINTSNGNFWLHRLGINRNIPGFNW